MSNFEEDDDESLEVHKPFCPKCGSVDIRHSQTHRALDFMLRSFGLAPFRCRSCRRRFYMRKPHEIEAEPEADNGHEPAPEPDPAKHKADS